MGAQESDDSLGKAGGDEEIIAEDVAESTRPDWTESEELSAKRKVDFTLLPILGLAFFALQIDRANIANALTSTITTDLHINTNQINAGTSLLSAGIVLLEIPSNILLQKVGPQRWLAGQIIAWGLVATFQNFITNYAGYIVTRLLLGLCEAGFIPGALYTMSTYYKKSETSLRISIFFLGNLLATATVSLIGAGILLLSGRGGVAGWRWLFIIEGAITISIGIIFILFIPQSVNNGSPLISGGKWSYFTPRETYILGRRVVLDDPAKVNGHLKISRQDVWLTVRNPRILIHVLISLISLISVTAVQQYSPSIIKSLGFGTVQANALYSVGAYCAVVLVVLLAFIADRTKRRGPSVLIAAAWSLIAYACLRQSIHHSKWPRYAAIVAANATNTVIHILNIGWVSVNCQGPMQRSIAMAMIVMAANCGSIAGAQVFRTEDAPLYLNAFTATLALSAICFIVIIGQLVWYFSSNRKLAKTRAAPIVEGNSEGLEISQTWWWTW